MSKNPPKIREIPLGEKRIEAYELAKHISKDDWRRTAMLAKTGLMDVALMGQHALRMRACNPIHEQLD